MLIGFLVIFVIFLITSCQCQYKNPYIYDNRSVIAQLFEWKHEDVAKECKFLAEKGFGAVQVSPVHESKVDDSNSFYLRYQPISYKVRSRSGDEEEFQAMVRECQKAKVRVYVDIVANHMAKGENEIFGTARSTATPSTLDYPAVPFTSAHFNEECAIKDPMSVFEIRNCRIDNLPDLNQANEEVRDAIVGFMNKLIDYGVAGFRMDSVKRMWPADLAAIYSRLKDLNEDFDFPQKSRPFIYQEVIDLGGGAISKNEYVGMGPITEYSNSKDLGLIFNGKRSLHQHMKAENGFVSSNDAIVFVDNHDNQRLFLDGFTEILNYKEKRRYILANSFMLANPYGLPKIMSSFAFKDPFDGPPMSDGSKIASPQLNEEGQCSNGWVCEHRWPAIIAMVKFRNVVGDSLLHNYADNGQNQIAFCRGELGFIAINNELSLNMKSSLKACVPAGTYCDIMTGGKVDGKCAGDEIVVDEDGKVDIFIPWSSEVPIIAIHVEARKD